jgi:hypothetical protein
MGYLEKKMLKIYEQSQNVYENKQNVDKIPDEKSGIYVEVMRFLQKGEAFLSLFAPCDGISPLNFGAFSAYCALLTAYFKPMGGIGRTQDE